ncbi:MAG: tRNA (guanosine(37)-N1)-methyltransferase TrmD [Thermomicrobiales bacterium]|nr:tRNA (guanosine(37)-N1)-methyltransferase TrmD [Thermomicrobiales bacterium]MCO5221251.1 tRNA (guanosine(37)-N1)-methyltransferase TrmD [Thermomicrobiales bacterium]
MTVRFSIFTLFPDMFAGPFGESIIRRAVENGKVQIDIHDIRIWTHDRHRTADDRPYGGGAGMVLMAPPIVEGVESVLAGKPARVLITSAGGRTFDQEMAQELAAEDDLVLICGHYEGIDARVTTLLDAEEVSIGNYVLTGGELPAMVIVDSVTRLLPGVIDDASIAEESHQDGLVEYPHYTRPAEYRGLAVPPVLLSGHHAEVAKWRLEQSIERTRTRVQTSK